MQVQATLEEDVSLPVKVKESAPRTSARWWQFLRIHRIFLLMLLVGAAVRAGAMVAYSPAFGYFMDSSYYVAAANSLVPSRIWPFGYPALLRVLSITGHTATVPLVQHLLGLFIGLGIYALLLKRGVSRTWAALGAAPVILDGRQITLEHYVLSETLFTTFVVAGAILLLWRSHPPAWICAAAGLAIAGATLTRTVGQVVAILVLGYLMVRRMGWHRIGAFALALVIPIGGYVIWYHEHYGVYALNQWSGRFMWQRTTTFVDCTRSDFTAEELTICPREPRGSRLVNDTYLWNLDSGQIMSQYPNAVRDDLFAGFARKAILGQPGDFAWTLFKDAIHFVQPGWQAPARIACTTDLWTLPSGGRATEQANVNCSALLMHSDFNPAPGPAAAPKATKLNGVLWAYSQTFVLPPLALLLMSLFAIGSACWRPRKLRSRDAIDSAFLAITGIAIVGLGLTLSVIDLRFTVPLLALLPPAVAIGRHRLTLPRESAAPAGRWSESTRSDGTPASASS